ncbi:diguanylate cyclase [Paenibacillus sp. CF384]|uniref:diguanylate cyclase n=1 Tax=Paenibacillus sp. CF384 TaxID=1884382 RepID=UPI0008978DDD|nr:diguanylate cyclase [Paenibacillus sp. CF384]SDW16131.1 diguanylate cyclase (GGDEF) domain-containing protein [Paenibacillus sp. CF384]
MLNSSSELLDNSSDEVLVENQKQYVSELRERLSVLRNLSELADDMICFEKARQIYRIVHSIKGSAPILGFDRIGSMAANMISEWEWTQEEGNEPERQVSLQLQFVESARVLDKFLPELEQELESHTSGIRPSNVQASNRNMDSDIQLAKRILIIEDDNILRGYLARKLFLDGYQVDEASNVEDAISLLRNHHYQLITLDLMMYPKSGYDIFEILKEDMMIRWIPMIVLSGRDDIRDKLRCFQMGADDYVVKPFHYDELCARIRRLIERNQEYNFMAFHDPLTGLFNRRYMDKQIQLELARVNRYPSPITMILLDIDYFKMINDNFGHQIGDVVLQSFSNILTSQLRKSDMIARWGGEEFMILMPGTRDAEAVSLVESVLTHVRENPIFDDHTRNIFITFSAGVVQWRPQSSVTVWTRHADFALYKAKRTGRNRVVKSSLRKTVAKKILVVEDDRVLRRMIVELVNGCSEQVLEATNGLEAYELLTKEDMDLCILDFNMPHLDGLAMLRRVNQEGIVSKRTKFLMVSGNESHDNIKTALTLGANGYITKPFTFPELKKKVLSLLQQR